ncbi:MAG: thioredoxin family protein [Hyphomicrobium sp.]
MKIDCDQSPAARDKYGVRGVPTLVIFKNGKPTARHVGPLVQRATLRKWVDASVGAPETRRRRAACRRVQALERHGCKW